MRKRKRVCGGYAGDKGQVTLINGGSDRGEGLLVFLEIRVKINSCEYYVMKMEKVRRGVRE